MSLSIDRLCERRLSLSELGFHEPRLDGAYASRAAYCERLSTSPRMHRRWRKGAGLAEMGAESILIWKDVAAVAAASRILGAWTARVETQGRGH
jgi:hypothetical protein